MAKAPMDLDIGDIIYITNAKKYARITNIRQWFEYYNDTVGALATLSNRKIATLDSGSAFIFYIESVEVLRDINLTLKYRNVNMQGSQGSGVITIHENGLGDPYMLNRFCFNQPWYAALTENLGLALTAQNLALFKGIELTIEDVVGEELTKITENKNFTPVPG